MSTQFQLNAVFASLSDTTRRRILKLLLEQDMTVTAIAEGFEISLAGISKHLQILEKSKLISSKWIGRQRYCRINLEGLQPAFSWLQEFGFIDEPLLNQIESFVDTDFFQRE